MTTNYPARIEELAVAIARIESLERELEVDRALKLAELERCRAEWRLYLIMRKEQLVARRRMGA
jgi:hypothetical protein